MVELPVTEIWTTFHFNLWWSNSMEFEEIIESLDFEPKNGLLELEGRERQKSCQNRET